MNIAIFGAVRLNRLVNRLYEERDGAGMNAEETNALEASMHGARAAMEPLALAVRYRDAESGEICTEEHDWLEPFSCDALTVESAFDGEVVEVVATVQRAMRLELARVYLRHAFSSEERVLLNGYQSWTDTVERPAFSRMRGLFGVPQVVMDRYAIHGGGDYEAVDYTARRGEMHGFTYATFRRGEGMVLVGSLDETRGFTLISTRAARGVVMVETKPPARDLAVGERLTLLRFAITRGTLDECYDRWFELSGISARPVKPLVGYTSWYRHYGDIDEQKLLHDLEGFGRGGDLVPGGYSETVLPLFQIDDGYSKVGDWLDVDAAKFPNGLASLAGKIREAGFLPGLWLAPFVCERDSRLARERSDWLLRDENGNPLRTGPQWSGGLALDTRNVEVRSYILEVLATMTEEWGFGLLKADFLYAACMVPHDGLNRGELMVDALDLLRRGAGDDTLILGCGVPLGSAFGKVDYCRIGCDVGLDWNDKLHMRMLHRERVSTKNSLGNTYGRAPLDGRAFGNDPDVFFLRNDVKLLQEQRDELLFADADCGSVFLTSDDRAQWTPDMRQRYDEALRVFLERHAQEG